MGYDMHIEEVLRRVQSGAVSVEEAKAILGGLATEDLGFAQVDHDRALRQGVAEVIYAEGKTPEQTARIAEALCARGASNVMATRIAPEHAILLQALPYPVEVHEEARIAVLCPEKRNLGVGRIAVCAAGTSDLAVAEEAAVTAETLGHEVLRIYDVGVAGLHRLLARLPEIRRANVLIAVAGMEGALPSVLTGLVDRPVVAVPTSVGYGVNAGGINALCSMLGACASGMVAVNIDNGFGAGYAAAMINQPGRPWEE